MKIELFVPVLCALLVQQGSVCIAGEEFCGRYEHVAAATYDITECFYSKKYQCVVDGLERFARIDLENIDDGCEHIYTVLFSYLGLAYLENEEFDKSIVALENMKKLSVDVFFPNYNIGKAYLYKGEYEKAKSYLSVAYKSKPNFELINYCLGFVCEKLGEESLATEYYMKEIKLSGSSEATSGLRRLRQGME